MNEGNGHAVRCEIEGAIRSRCPKAHHQRQRARGWMPQRGGTDGLALDRISGASAPAAPRRDPFEADGVVACALTSSVRGHAANARCGGSVRRSGESEVRRPH